MDIITRKQAQQQGLVRYFTGKPCRHGHVVERLVCDGSCKTCANEKKARRYKADPQRYRDQAKVSFAARRAANPNLLKEAYEKNKEEIKAKSRRYRAEKKALDPDFDKKNHAKRNKDVARASQRAYQAKRRQEDPCFKLMGSVRSYLCVVLKEARAMRSGRYRELIGCNAADLKAHLEKQFRDGMSWENHGEWHIDHIRPCASFDLTDPAQQRECFHYTNLQPLWAAENLSKRHAYAA